MTIINQPTNQIKLDTLADINTGWSYSMRVPPVPTHLWTPQDWINFIGDNWYPTKSKQTLQKLNNLFKGL